MRNRIPLILLLALAIAQISFVPTAKSVTKTVTLSPAADTFVFEMYPDKNYGNYHDMFVGKHLNGNIYNILISFNIVLPANAQLVSAKLVLTLRGLYYFSDAGTTSKKIYVCRVLESWGEYTVTWNNQPSSICYGYFNVLNTDSAGKKYEVDVTSIVKKWLDEGYPNYGFKLVGDNQIGVVNLWAKEASAADSRPKLVITYKIPAVDVDATPSSVTVKQGESATYQVSVTASDYTGNVQLSLTGLPSGSAYSLNPNSGTPPFNSILTVTTSDTTPPGTYTLKIKAQGTGVQDTKKVKLVVTKKGDFDIILNPSSLSLKQGGSANVNIQVVPIESYDETVTLSLPTVPSGITATLGTNTLAPGASTTLSIQLSDTIAPGTYNIVVKGVSDGIEHTKSLTINVEEEPFDFTLTLTPQTIEVKQGEEVSVTVKLVLASGATKPVSLSLSGLPPATSYSFSPETVTPTGSSTLTIQTTNLEGSYSVTIHGVADGIEKTANLKLKVIVEKFDFELSVQPTSVEIEQGETTTLVVKVTLTSGEPEDVALSLMGLPAEATYVFNPPVVTPSGSSILTINAGSAKGTFTVLVKGSGGGVEKSTVFTITIKEKKCIIATSTYGSEVEPEVEFLRGFRDNIVLSTYAGRMFYSVFNPFYYSWSPYVAHYLNENPQLKPYMRVILYPLLASLKISAIAAVPLMPYNPELAVFLAGAIASTLIGLAYFGLPTLVVRKKMKRRELMVILVSLASAIFSSIVSELLALDILLALSTSIYVLAFIAIGAYILPLLLLQTYRRLNIKF